MSSSPDQLYRSACGAAFRDGRVSDGERILLDRLRNELGLSIQDAAAIEERMGQVIEPRPDAGELDPADFVRGLVRSARAQGASPTPEDRAQLVGVARLVGVPENLVLQWLGMPLDLLRREGREKAAVPLDMTDWLSYLGVVTCGYGGGALLLAMFFLPAIQESHFDVGKMRIAAFFLAMPALAIPGTHPDGPLDVTRTRAALRWLLAGAITVAAGSVAAGLGKLCWELRAEPLIAGVLLVVTAPLAWRLLGYPVWGALIYASDPHAAPVFVRALASWEDNG